MLTRKQQIIKERRKDVGKAYKSLKEGHSVTLLVDELALKHKVTTVTIYSDLSAIGLTENKKGNGKQMG